MGKNAKVPEANELLPLRISPGLHPCCFSDEDLSRQCELRTQRRSGPGGQHRNKTSSGVFLLHSPTGVTAEATERRSQADNRRVALARMQLRLAIEVRTASPLIANISIEEKRLRERLVGRRMRIARQHQDYPILLALLLNDMYFVGGQPSLVVDEWKVGSSVVVRYLKTCPPALIYVNSIREHHRRLPLR